MSKVDKFIEFLYADIYSDNSPKIELIKKIAKKATELFKKKANSFPEEITHKFIVDNLTGKAKREIEIRFKLLHAVKKGSKKADVFREIEKNGLPIKHHPYVWKVSFSAIEKMYYSINKKYR